MTNLLYKASIVTTPTAYGVGVLNSIKPAISFGEELIVNGNFSTDSDWAKVNATISSGQATITVTGGGFSGIGQTLIYTSGRKYRLIANIKGASGSSGKQVRFMDNSSNTGGLTTSNGVVTLNESVQNIEIIWTANSNSNSIRNDRNTSSGDYSWIVYDISIKEITDADFDFTRTSSATRVNPDYLIETVSINSANLVQNGNFSELGSEAVTNGDFATGIVGWAKLADNEISTIAWNAGAMNVAVTGVGTDVGRPRIQGGMSTTVIGAIYKFQFDVVVNSGTPILQHYNVGGLTTISQSLTTGTHTFYTTATSVSTVLFLYFNGTNLFNIDIDNVSVKQVDPNDNWTLGTGWSFGTNKANAIVTSDGQFLTSSTVLTIGSKYKLTFSAVVTSGEVRHYNGGFTGITANTTGTVTGIFTATETILRFYSSAFVGSITDVSVIEIQENGVPRLDYTNGTASILLENQSTNIIPYSEDFSQWNNARTTDTANQTTSPDGLNNGTLIEQQSGQTNAGSIYISVSGLSNGATYTTSIYAKKKDKNYIVSYDSNANRTYFDLEEGYVGTLGSGVTAEIIALHNGWYRCVATFNSSLSGATNIGWYLGDTDNSTVVTDNGGVYIYGAQFEQSSFPTSYIPTSGQSGGVTRAAETLNNAGNSDLINSTEGVLYVEIATNNLATFKNISINDGSNSNRINLFIYNAALSVNFDVGGVTQASLSYTIPEVLSFNKFAFSYKINEFKLFVNGTQRGSTDTSGIVPPINTFNKLSFNDSFGNPFHGRCKTVAVFSESLSDTELACLTSTNNREIFLNYYYRMQYVGANTEALSCAQQTFNI